MLAWPPLDVLACAVVGAAALPTPPYTEERAASWPGKSHMIDWVPVVFVVFKVLVFGTCMFFAVKWHYDQGRKKLDKRALLLTAGKLGAVFLVALAILLFFTFTLAKHLGMDLSLP